MKLAPFSEKTVIKGRLVYDCNARACNKIRLKKEFVQRFPQVKKKDAKIEYEMTIYTTYRELFNNLKTMEEQKEPIPIMMSFEEILKKSLDEKSVNLPIENRNN